MSESVFIDSDIILFINIIQAASNRPQTAQ